MRILKSIALAALLLAGTALHAAAQRGQMQQIGSFVIFPDADPITDMNRTTAMTPSADSLAFVGWQCHGDTAGMFVVMEGTPGGDEADIMYRFDQDAPDSTVLAQTGQDGKVWLWFPLDETYALTQRAMTASRLVVRWWDVDESTNDLIFNLGNSGRALRSLPCVTNARPPVIGSPARRKASEKPG
ncbi:MAG TPA: hypothetical protein VF771_10835 [Longimicrobiaceae bacterium]